MLPALAVSFDFGQTLAELDAEMLSRRLAERGHGITAARIDAAVPSAWRAYNDAIAAGFGGHPWKILMREMLAQSGVSAEAIPALCDYFWDEQPMQNLWRRPVPGMIELLRDLRRAKVPVATLSNSEGRLAELIEELDWQALFQVVADSGKLGFGKPDRAIFEWTSAGLGVPLDRIVHIGDSFGADIEGALAAGMLAIWFTGDRASAPKTDRLVVCDDAAETRAALAAWGISAALPA